MPTHNPLLKLIRRAASTSIVWYWAYNCLRLASGLLLLPLLVRVLSKPDLGMYYVFLSLTNLIPMLDLGFTGAIGRAAAYAWSGSKDIQAQGIVSALDPDAKPNHELIWKLYYVSETLFGWLTLAALLVLGAVGTYVVGLRIHETSAPNLTWLAWAVTLLGALWEVYSGWWFMFLAAMNQIVRTSKLMCLAYGLRLALSCILLLCGAGLLSVPIAGFISAIVHRFLLRKYFHELLNVPPPKKVKSEVYSLLARIWPNSWRQGLTQIGGYGATTAYAFICLKFFGLSANAEYGLSIQIMYISLSMASVWVNVKWPAVYQLRAKHEFGVLQRMLTNRFWLQNITYIGLVALGILLGPKLLKWWGSEKTLLPMPVLILAGVYVFLESQFLFWSTLISTENRMPCVWPMLIGNSCGLLLALVLINFTSLQLSALVISPVLVGLCFNYWYWGFAGARGIKTTWLRFIVPSAR
jgi:O-antigen/teichoic acid export membrane protein